MNIEIIERITRKFEASFSSAPLAVLRAPGRVNLLGEHVDYNDGFVMPAAIQRATYLAVSPSRSSVSTIVALDFNREVSITAHSISKKQQADGSSLPDWAFYPAGVAWALAEAGQPVEPILAVFASDVPRGAGLSSSASVEVAFVAAWQHFAPDPLPRIRQASLCLRAESAYVGVHCGIMDQFASLFGVQDHILHLDCRSLDWCTLQLPADVSIVIADTMVRRKLSSGEYNLRRQDCEQAVRLLKPHLPAIRSLRDVSPGDLDRLHATLPVRVAQRARHVVAEITRTESARLALQRGDVTRFAGLMNECHVSLRDLYEVSCPELDAMVSIALSLDGCLGARLTGAGFGGCTVNLVENTYQEAFVVGLKTEYLAKTGLSADVTVSRPSAGAGIVPWTFVAG